MTYEVDATIGTATGYLYRLIDMTKKQSAGIISSVFPLHESAVPPCRLAEFEMPPAQTCMELLRQLEGI